MINNKLNDTQRKLVEDNHNLIYAFLNSHNLSLDAVEDWYGTAAIGLCKAALLFDESRGAKFTTLAYVCMNNEIGQIIRKCKKCITCSVSLDCKVSESNEMLIKDCIPDKFDFMNQLIINDAIRLATQDLSNRDQEIINMIVDQGMKQHEVATKVGLSRQTVSKIYSTFISKINKYLDF